MDAPNLAAMILGPQEESELATDEFETVAGEFLAGIDKKDPKAVAKGLKAFFAMCDAIPHEEGEHLEEG